MAQHTVKIKITEIPESHRDQPVYITGNFNRWLPAEPTMQMQLTENGGYEITLQNIPVGLLEYKFTRGDWDKLACTTEGFLAGPNSVIVDQDTVLNTTIEAWRDDFPKSTATPQVHLLDEAFKIPQLGRDRRIWIYLPDDYITSDKKYPVLYMHDGQDLFDEATSKGRTGPVEWAVDETINQSSKKMIVIAIDHHPETPMRLTEYYYRPNPEHPHTEGDRYLDFIVNTLKPYIDKHYRTLPNKQNTAMAGASMGGLLTLYAGLNYPDTFGTLGVFSPSIWLDYGNVEHEIESIGDLSSINQQRYFFYAGDNESRIKPDGSIVRMHEDVEKVANQLSSSSSAQTAITIRPGGRHGAWHWRQTFPEFYDWLVQKQE